MARQESSQKFTTVVTNEDTTRIGADGRIAFLLPEHSQSPSLPLSRRTSVFNENSHKLARPFAWPATCDNELTRCSQRFSSGDRSQHRASTLWASGTLSHNEPPKSSAICSSPLQRALSAPPMIFLRESRTPPCPLALEGTKLGHRLIETCRVVAFSRTLGRSSDSFPLFALFTSDGASRGILQPFQGTKSTSSQRADTSRAQSLNFRLLDTSEEPLPLMRHQAHNACFAHG